MQPAARRASKSADIARNAKAARDYFIEDRLEAGVALEGWEVKSLRERRLQMNEGHAYIRDNAAWLIGAHISPLPHCAGEPDPTRTRKLLLHKKEISRLVGATERKGYTLVPLRAYWRGNRVKIELGLGKGKREHDRRADTKKRDWEREKSRILKNKR